MVYQIIWDDCGYEEIAFETDNVVVAGILFDYVKQMCEYYNNLSFRFSMDVRIESMEE